MKKGFTLTELLVALTVIGGLIAILTPIISRLMPNENMLRAKKAYHIAVVTVQQMLNNQACYPDISQFDDKDVVSNPFRNYFKTVDGKRVPIYTGLSDPHRYSDCKRWLEGGDASDPDYDDNGRIIKTSENARTKLANQKFAKVFMDEIGCYNNTNDAGEFIDIYEMPSEHGEGYICQTKDGMQWKFDYTANAEDPYIRVYIDVNGTDKPNRKQKEIKYPTEGPIWFRDFKYKVSESIIGKDYSVDVDDDVDGKQSYDTLSMDVDPYRIIGQ